MTEVVSMDLPHERGGAIGSAVYAPSRGARYAPESMPNPHFTFPARPADADPGSDASDRPSSGRPSGSSRTRQASLSSRRGASALPAFTFNPSGSSAGSTTSAGSEDTPSTPPTVPSPTLANTPSRHMGHRRGGSEFIGGDGHTGGTGLLSTSPTKGDGVLTLPGGPARLGPPNGKRGHAHRRSGAISCHDLQSILQPTDANPKIRSGSAPVTPQPEPENKNYFVVQSRRTTSQGSLSMLSEPASQTSSQPSSQPSSPPPEMEEGYARKAHPRVRVGFSERIEYIRPLSTISSETESSMSTIRGHSVNGSLSSLVSTGTASPASVRTGRPSLQTTVEEVGIARPRTASDVLDFASPGRGNFSGSLTMPERPRSAIALESPSAPSPPSESPVKAKHQSKKRHLGWFESRRSSRSPTRVQADSLPASRSEPSLVVTPPEIPSTPLYEDPQLAEPVEAVAVRTAADSEKKPRKARSWTHSLKALRHRQKTTAPEDADDDSSVVSTPQATTPATEEEDAFPFTLDFDADNTIDIVTAPALQPVQPGISPRLTAVDSSVPDVTSPVIDLDAALGPFNSPATGLRHPFPRMSGFQRRSMHSGSMGAGVFNLQPPHRRTESAPELVPFDGRNSRMTSSPPMADVFEEEEEDEYFESKVKATKPTSVKSLPDESTADSGVGIQVVDSSDGQVGSGFAWTMESGLGVAQLSPKEPSLRPSPILEGETRRASSPLAYAREDSPVEVVEDYEEPRTGRDSDSTITPPLLDEDSKRPPSLMRLDMPLPSPAAMTPDTFSSSPLSTPDYCGRSSRPSFETPRIGTAASSITDSRTMSSFAFGEPNPDYRSSVDDVPSLTSSRSTMTAPSQPPQHPLSQTQTFSRINTARSVSVASIPSAGSERARKRGSIASLSRLVSGSFERSKLSIESRPQSQAGMLDDVAEGRRKKKNRISRLMTFWKSKEMGEA